MPRARKIANTDTAAVVRRQLKKAATRVNAKEVTDFLSYKPDKANKDTKGKTKFVPRKREPNEALPPEQTWKGTTYKTGDGDILQLQRPGSDLSWIKSFGDRT